jgi:hypothetical protein
MQQMCRRTCCSNNLVFVESLRHARRRSPPCSLVLRASAPMVSPFASAPIDAGELRGRAAPWCGAPRRKFLAGHPIGGPVGGAVGWGARRTGSVDATRHEDDKLGTRAPSCPMSRCHARAPARLGPVGISPLGRAPRPRSLDRMRKKATADRPTRIAGCRHCKSLASRSQKSLSSIG